MSCSEGPTIVSSPNDAPYLVSPARVRAVECPFRVRCASAAASTPLSVLLRTATNKTLANRANDHDGRSAPSEDKGWRGEAVRHIGTRIPPLPLAQRVETVCGLPCCVALHLSLFLFRSQAAALSPLAARLFRLITSGLQRALGCRARARPPVRSTGGA
jgi:hypothetical protein